MARPLLTICKNAAHHMKQIAIESPHSSVVIGVQGGGCNGLKYFIEPPTLYIQLPSGSNPTGN